MSEQPRVVIRKLPSGVPGLDEVLGGGVPEYSFNLIAGAPGTGKTTMAQQIMFANATPQRPAVFFTVLGEPPVKMLRYQQQFGFFDPKRVGVDIHFINLTEEVLHRNLDAVLDRITREVETRNPSIVIVDSFRTVVRTTEGPDVSELDLQYFVQRLALRLTSWETTSFLIGEFAEGESRNPVFTVADGVIWLLNEVERNSSVRKLRVTKVSEKQWRIEGKTWPDGQPEPAPWTIAFDDPEEPPPGRASLWAEPFSGKPVRFDDLAAGSN